jgi:hypothetical protein
MAAAGLALMAGCAGLGGPKVITLSETDLAARLDRQLPFERRLLEVFEVHITAPRIRLMPEANRLATEFDVEVSDRVFGRAVSGRLALDYALRYDAQAQAIRLADVHVGTLAIDGVPGNAASAAQSIGPLVAEQLLEGLPIYRFRPEDLKTAQGLGFEPGGVAVTSRGVEITLRPSR